MSGNLAKKGLIILDRDGVINRDSDAFVKSAAEWIPLPGSIAAIAALSGAGYTIAIASNQSGIARGLFNQDALQTMHDKLRKLVVAEGGSVDKIVVCPHGPDDGCDCRKPRPGLLLQLADHYNTDLSGVPVIGDSLRDVQAAVAVSARPLLVRTGNGNRTEASLPEGVGEIEVFDDLAAATAVLVLD